MCHPYKNKLYKHKNHSFTWNQSFPSNLAGVYRVPLVQEEEVFHNCLVQEAAVCHNRLVPEVEVCHNRLVYEVGEEVYHSPLV